MAAKHNKNIKCTLDHPLGIDGTEFFAAFLTLFSVDEDKDKRDYLT
jgi:hypothetical protein